MAKENVKATANLSCSFCGKSHKDVKKLIAGPTVSICDECIGLCNDIIAADLGARPTEQREPTIHDPAGLLRAFSDLLRQLAVSVPSDRRPTVIDIADRVDALEKALGEKAG